MKVEKIHHVAILVKDLEKTGKLFAELFGFEYSGPNEHKEADFRNLVTPLGINLITPLSPDGVTTRTLNQRGEGLCELSLTVSNVAEATAEMKSRGIRQVGAARFHPKDLHGVLIELTEN